MDKEKGLLNHNTGKLGEEIACKYLKSKGLSILYRNYLCKSGEIDIIAQSNSSFSHETDETISLKVPYETHQAGKIIHFIEVKSVSYETSHDLDKYVSYGTSGAEELVDSKKLIHLSKAIETWVHDNNWNGLIQIDVIAVYMVPREKIAKVRYFSNIESDS